MTTYTLRDRANFLAQCAGQARYNALRFDLRPDVRASWAADADTLDELANRLRIQADMDDRCAHLTLEAA